MAVLHFYLRSLAIHLHGKQFPIRSMQYVLVALQQKHLVTALHKM